ncbi:class I SAM-dependent methyltransferase [Helicobacter sp. 13S00477-4]|uniref:class I SAM-dependent methyltransferase n=1 Tax=Helicobacter sp. 13S00477-4 TaxID=1905759 RepID=UPI001C5E0B29|nr:class I SAM-dependent methyltransferase [Helicobacter sp. 13S00477-4]
MLDEIKKYWSDRSESYANENLAEILDHRGKKWQEVFKTYAPIAFEKMKVLDVGCGPGIFSILLALLGAKVSAVDYTPKMLDFAKKNASSYKTKINFFQADAQNLAFENDCFDLVVSRNLTWNLSHPQKAYKEWHRVLKQGGRFLNFDANWYLQLYDDGQKKAYEKDREKTQKIGIPDHMTTLYPNAKKMEEIAKSLPLSKIHRPEWDEKILKNIGFEILVCDKNFYQQIWNEEEKIMFASTPMFLIVAQK